MKKLAILCLALFYFSVNSNAQTLKQFEKAGMQALQVHDFYAALDYYSKALMIEGDKVENIYNHAQAARQFGALTLAKESYEKVEKSNRKDNFPLTGFWLANVHQNMGNYEKAKMLYQQFIQKNKSNSSYADYRIKAEALIEETNYALKLINKMDERIEVVHLGKKVNSPYADVSPMPDGEKLYYSSLKYEKKKDKYPARRKISKMLVSNNGKKGHYLKNFNIEGRHVAHTAFNADKSCMYFTICDYTEGAKIRCQIYYKTRTVGDNWSSETPLPDFINNKDYTSTQPNMGLSPDGEKALYFVSDRPGGKGNLDIWYSVMNSDGSFNEPQNLSNINTVDNDIAPFYHRASHTLYFSSDGHQGLGGYDIFKTEKADFAWTRAENVGPPLNSSFNDIDYYLNDEGTKGYFSSNRIGAIHIDKTSETCCNDIYKVNIEKYTVDLNAITWNKKTKEPLNGVKVELEEITEKVYRDQMDENKNDYFFPLDFEKRYMVFGTKEGYTNSDTIYLTTEELKGSKSFLENLYLQPKEVDLTALTFDARTGLALNGVKVELVEVKTEATDPKTDLNGNKYFYPLEFEKRYKLVATKAGYFSAESPIVTTEGLKDSKSFLEKLYLKKLNPLLDFGVVPLYFENDHPNPRTRKTVTEKKYSETYNNYIPLEQKYVDEYTKPLSEADKAAAEFNLRNFFTSDVKRGFERLELFSAYLLEYLQAGNRAKLTIQGFASPRAKAGYNEALTKRRINSVINYLKTTLDKQLAPFMEGDNPQLMIVEDPYGEVKARAGISDKIDDPRNSWYSVDASKERRVEIKFETN